MDVLRTIDEVRARQRELGVRGDEMGDKEGVNGWCAGVVRVFVPTMGALHAGHLGLVGVGRGIVEGGGEEGMSGGSPASACGALGGGEVWVSVFVNPTQFAPHEDLAAYPRPVEEDLAKCEAAGVDVVFLPSVEEMYPAGEPEVRVEVPGVGGAALGLEGAARPQFFGGVCRVVAKLFNIVQPTHAVFGKKDYQQLAVIRAMVQGLAMPVEIVAGETVREADGLAMSSRNAYLGEGDRAGALGLSKALKEAERMMVVEGVRDVGAVELGMVRVLKEHGLVVDYAVVRHRGTLRAIEGELDLGGENAGGGVVCLIAARLGLVGGGEVRLIDNLEVGG